MDRWSRLDEALGTGCASSKEAAPLTTALGPFRAALSDDLNVAGAIGALSQAVGSYAIDGAAGDVPENELDALRTMLKTLGVLGLDRAAASGNLDEAVIETKISERTTARTARDWATSDRIRDELLGIGVAIKDGPDGTTWTRIVR